MSRFIQIHTLTSYPGVLLNRDDAGFAKRLPFGGVIRTRVSSQCLKRHWRMFNGENSLAEIDAPRSYRSRRTFEEKVARELLAKYPKALVNGVVQKIIEEVVGKTDDNPLRTSQLTVLGEPEVNYLKEQAERALSELINDKLSAVDPSAEELSKSEVKDLGEFMKVFMDKEFKQNLKGLGLAAGLDAAIFGRMVTTDVLARGDAAIHVAHAITVHAEESESDYFAAIDDLVVESGSGELGSGHINSTELTSGLFYTYVVVDVPLLVSNLTGVPAADWESADRELAADVVAKLVKIIATVTPGAKLGSTAPYAHSSCVIAECGSSQPRTLANAFQKPVPNRGDVLLATYDALGTYVSQVDEMYGKSAERKIAAIGDTDALVSKISAERGNIAQLAEWVADYIKE